MRIIIADDSAFVRSIMIKAIKDKFPMPNIIVASADIQKATHEELNQMWIFKYINKPLTAEKLSAIVDAIKGESYA